MQPANPYLSCLVEASAGSGKTHQLSERFLSLVASGADPSKILTITFTIKAAAEMRSRILSKAMELALIPEKQQAFEQRMAGFQKESEKTALPTMRSAKKTGEAVLAESQALRISTIDSVFLEWAHKFPDESGVSQEADLGDRIQLEMLKRLAWERTLEDSNVAPDLKYLLDLDEDSSLHKIYENIKNLNRFDNAIFLVQENPLQLWEVETKSLESLFDKIRAPLKEITTVLKKYIAEIDEALAEFSLEKLIQSKVITKGGKVSGSIVKGEKRIKLSHQISVVDDSLQDYFLSQILSNTNQEAVRYFSIWQAFAKQYEELKRQNQQTEFSDLAKGVYKIFNGDESIGVTWLIRQGINHLLIDEFQDTSSLQWKIFKSLSQELLSGQNEWDSVFIVGDRKQSIYGFREADPSVLDDAGKLIKSQAGHIIEMSKSYRSSPAVLEAVNHLLGERIENYPRHESANDGSKLLTPSIGGVWCLENQTDNELNHVADTIQLMLNNSRRFPIGKGTETGGLRPLRPGDIAVLYRTTSHADKLEELLRSRGISCMKEEKKGFFNRSEILDLKYLLQWLAFPHDEYSLLAFLSGPIGGFTGEDYEIIFVSHSPNRVWEHLAEKNKDIFQTLAEFKSKVDTLPIEVFMLELWQRFKVPDTYRKAYGGSEGTLAAQNLEKFLLMSSAFRGRIADFLLKIEEGIKLDEDGNAASESLHAVRLMTIHKSKGLEYPAVFVLGLGKPWDTIKDRWVKNKEGKIFFLPLKGTLGDNLSYEDILPDYTEEVAAEIKRLLYVALTRASQYLILSNGYKPTSEKSKKKNESKSSAAADWFFKDERLTFLNQEVIEQRVDFWAEKLAKSDQSGSQSDSPREFAVIPRQIDSKQLHRITREIRIINPSRDLSRPMATNELAAFGGRMGLGLSDPEPTKVFGKEQMSKPEFDRETKDGSIGKKLIKKPLSEELAAAAGVFFHKAMEIYVRDGVVSQLEELWRECVDEGLGSSKIRDAFITLVEQTCQSEDFKQLLHGAQHVKTEASYGRLDGANLERGTMDLVIEYPEEVLVLDYKTSAVDDTTDLRQNAQQSGYQVQIEFYKRALANLYPNKKVRGMLWYAQVSKLVEI